VNDKTEVIEVGEYTPIDQPANLPMVDVQRQHNMKLMELALTSGSMESLEKLMELQERWEAGQARKSFYQALPRFQSKLPIITKNGLASFPHKNGNGYTEYSYAKLEDIAKAIKPLLEEFNISYRFEQHTGDKMLITITCIVTHSDGHEERTEMSGYPDQSGSKNSMQQSASTVQYLRRYTLTGALGITVSDEDDDAQGAAEQGEQTEQQEEFYPEDRFNKNFLKWELAIASGKITKKDVIDKANSKHTLSKEQIKQIENIVC